MSHGVQPILLASGNTSVATNATGATYNAFPALPCHQFTLVNDTGSDLEVQQDAAGVAIPVPSGTFYTFYGISNANQLGVRRKDTSSTTVTVKGRWEA